MGPSRDVGVVLSIGKLAAGPAAGRYYVEQVALGREDYYAGEGEQPGAWVGIGAASLGARGEVSEDGLSRLMAAADPVMGTPLRRPMAEGGVAGFDLTFRAPKSVSVLFGIGSDEVAGALRAGHEAAVVEALGYLEREACRARRGRGGVVQVAGSGFVAAAFGHRSSRAGDPLLHTHVVVGNVTRGPDSRWTALDGRELYRHAKTAGYLYQAALRTELTDRLGVEWNEVERGTADVRGVPRKVIEHFSQRRAEILERMQARGEHSAKAAQVATLDTRRAKTYDVSPGRLREQWRARAAEHGLNASALASVLRTARTRPAEPAEQDRVMLRLAGPEGLTEERSTFTRRDVVQAFAEAAPPGTGVRDIEQHADAFLAGGTLVRLEDFSSEARFTTVELLDIEQGLLDGAQNRRAEGAGVVATADRSKAMASRPTLTAEQRELVTRLTGSGDGVEVVLAPAGTGKTFALDAAREAWQRAGGPVLGCALSARAAAELRDQAAVDATTIARLKHSLDHGATLEPGGVLIVDEAGMVGTRDLAVLANAARDARAKLVLVGDDRQLPEIDAGGAFRALAGRLGAIELREVRRQREVWDRDALTALRAGEVEQFAREYQQHGRIVTAPSADAARQALVKDWYEAHQLGEEALMIAYRRSDVADLNTRARQLLHEAGRLEPDADQASERAFAVGDRVITTRNDRQLEVINGQAGTLAAVDEHALTIDLDAGRQVELPRGYVEDGYLDHGYAITAHRAQGATVDRAFVLGSDELYREWGYTALSRHRDEARFYIAASPTFLNQTPAPLNSDDATDAVTRMLQASRAEHLALHGVRPDTLNKAMTDKIARAQASLQDVEQRDAQLRDERDQTRWYQREQRDRLDGLLRSSSNAQAFWHQQIEGHEADLADRLPPAQPATLRRAHDPLTARGRDLVLQAPTRMPAPPDRGPDLGI